MRHVFQLGAAAQLTAQGLLTVLARGGPRWLLYVLVVLQGAASGDLMRENLRGSGLVASEIFVWAGVSSIHRPVVTRQLLGSEDFGVSSGVMQCVSQAASAAAPTAAAALWARGGYRAVRLAIVVMLCAGSAAFVLAGGRAKRERGV